MKHRLLTIYSIIYGLAVLGFTIYWATNFLRHIIYKGDEFFMLAEYLLVAAYIFYFVIQFTVKKINFLIVLSIPILASIGAFCIGTLFLLVTQITSIPRHYILTYGFLYALLTLLAVLKFW